jgi:hypothetical protein
LLEEFYPSIRINIWCYPTSRVFSISCVEYCGEWFGLFLVISEVYLQIWYRYTTFGIRALSLGKEGKKFLVIFAELFLRKKGATHFRLRYETLCS